MFHNLIHSTPTLSQIDSECSDDPVSAIIPQNINVCPNSHSQVFAAKQDYYRCCCGLVPLLCYRRVCWNVCFNHRVYIIRFIVMFFRGFMTKSCDCLWGFKGADCGVPCISASRTDVCSLNPNRFLPGCAISTNVPCNGKGTFDSQDFRYQPGRDDIYDCEPDGSCVCRRGYQGQACEIGQCIIICHNILYLHKPIRVHAN